MISLIALDIGPIMHSSVQTTGSAKQIIKALRYVGQNKGTVSASKC
jgi:hypothetical protein